MAFWCRGTRALVGATRATKTSSIFEVDSSHAHPLGWHQGRGSSTGDELASPQLHSWHRRAEVERIGSYSD
ncbi:hypothetical protein RRG08_024160 [Elysia crispata]|uniref:Uncharacterized protein n=1 Tax=Elysia crispata TaxID=231223 RepID=A0AAE1D2Q3_9GAST|nr:hypothetical protein RRG08_024160 [Elysia crispata]